MSHASRETPRITVLGGGAWGTVLSLLALRAGAEVRQLVRGEANADRLRHDRVNQAHLPGVRLPPALRIESDMAAALAGATFVLVAVPSLAVRPTLVALAPYWSPATALILCSKGVEPEGFRRLSQVAEETLPHARVAVLSGPNLAHEIATGKPTATTVASTDATLAASVQSVLNQPSFRVYTSTDVVGVEAAAALKNVIALAAGMSDGLALGDNAKATIITRGLAELVRLGTFLGGSVNTFYGLAGLGDLVATCTSGRSRNVQAGVMLAGGTTLAELESSRLTAEGIPTVLAVHRMLQRTPLELPISQQVYDVIYAGASPEQAIHALMRREPRAE